jgi:uncharacterized protein (DUF302 family)
MAPTRSERNIMNIDVPYGITRRLEGVGVEAARARIIEALKTEGFGVLTEIDVQATLKKKLGVDTEPYVILGACNPALAHQALARDPGIGLLLPCNVVVTRDGDGAIVSAVDPHAMFAVLKDPAALAGLADDAAQRLRRAVAGA